MRHNEAERADKRKARDDAEKQKTEAYRIVFNTPEGKVVLEDIMEKGNIWFTTFTGNSQTYFLEGKRDLALYIVKRITKADPNVIANLMKDNIDTRYLRQTKREESNNANG